MMIRSASSLYQDSLNAIYTARIQSLKDIGSGFSLSYANVDMMDAYFPLTVRNYLNMSGTPIGATRTTVHLGDQDDMYVSCCQGVLYVCAYKVISKRG